MDNIINESLVGFISHAKSLEHRDPFMHDAAKIAQEYKYLRDFILTKGYWKISPCIICGYDGDGYYQSQTHGCVALLEQIKNKKG